MSTRKRYIMTWTKTPFRRCNAQSFKLISFSNYPDKPGPIHSGGMATPRPTGRLPHGHQIIVSKMRETASNSPSPLQKSHPTITLV